MSEQNEADRVEVRFEADSDGTGELHVTATSHGFAGDASAWFNTEELEDFAALLATYPLVDAPPPRIAGGSWTMTVPGELEQELVSLEARRVGLLGQIALRVHLASEVWPPDELDDRSDVHLILFTTYERMSTFSEELAQVVRGELAVACLEAELMGRMSGTHR